MIDLFMDCFFPPNKTVIWVSIVSLPLHSPSAFYLLSYYCYRTHRTERESERVRPPSYPGALGDMAPSCKAARRKMDKTINKPAELLPRGVLDDNDGWGWVMGLDDKI